MKNPLTIQKTLTLCKAMGCTARYIADTREFRIVPQGGKESAAYYTDDAADAIYTAIALNRQGFTSAFQKYGI